ncbi:MAG: hypothetical protein II819_05005, partial [Fibrobacter sp.]|nr:hypothetical protein [Fibrobacter sp.]
MQRVCRAPATNLKARPKKRASKIECGHQAQVGENLKVADIAKSDFQAGVRLWADCKKAKAQGQSRDGSNAK